MNETRKHARLFDPDLFGKSPCCGRVCTLALVDRERSGRYHVRLEFWADRHDKHLYMDAHSDEELVYKVNGVLA